MAEAKKMVIYYSRADENYGVGYIKKGNTEIVAEMIAKKVGADLLKVEPVKEYAKDYNTCITESKKELAADARPSFKAVTFNPNDYDEFYVGYPVWWGEMPMTMFTFFEQYSLKEKLLHPFVTHEGSGLSGTSRLQKVTGGILKHGLAVYGHIAQKEPAKAAQEIDSWLK